MTTEQKMETRQVFESLLGERTYQKRRWGHRQEDGSYVESSHSVCDYLVFMQDYLTDTLRRASREDGYEGALDSLRKVVALGVRCFEEHGCPLRDLRMPVINAKDGLPA